MQEQAQKKNERLKPFKKLLSLEERKERYKQYVASLKDNDRVNKNKNYTIMVIEMHERSKFQHFLGKHVYMFPED